MDYIPLVTDDFRIAFCSATSPLCSDIKHIIWKKLLYEDIEYVIPPAPQKWKKSPIYSRTSSATLPRDLFESLTSMKT